MSSTMRRSKIQAPAFTRSLGAVPGGGFSTKPVTSESLVDDGDPEGRWVVDGRECQREYRLRRLVLPQRFPKVEVEVDVAVQHPEAFRNTHLLDCVADGARQIQPLTFHNVANPEPVVLTGRVGLGEVLVHPANREHDVVNSGAAQPLKQVLNRRAVQQRDKTLVPPRRERPQPCPLSTDQDDCVHAVLPEPCGLPQFRSSVRFFPR